MITNLLKIAFFFILNIVLFMQYSKIENIHIYQSFVLAHIIFAIFVYFTSSRIGGLVVMMSKIESTTSDIIFSTKELTEEESELYRKYCISSSPETAKQLLSLRSLTKFNFYDKSFSNEELAMMVTYAVGNTDKNK